VWQDDVIQKYGLSSITLEKFFLGPLPEFHMSGSSHFTPPTAMLPAVIDGLTITDLDLTAGTVVVVNDMGVIDLTEDDVDVLSAGRPSTAVAKTPAENRSVAVQNNNHKKTGWFCFSKLFT